MNEGLINTKLVDEILMRRDLTLHDILADKRCLSFDSQKNDMQKLVIELDKVFYTIDFLEINNLISLNKNCTNTIASGFFDGVTLKDNDSDIYGSMFYYNKFAKECAMGWKIGIKPGLVSFKRNNYRTNEQVKNELNFWLPIAVGLGSAAVTAILTAILE